MASPSIDSAIFESTGYGGEVGVALLLRLQLLRAVRDELVKRGWSQNEAARNLRVKQPRISEIMQLRIDKFSVENLAKLSFRLGLKVSLSIGKTAG
jgi:predicted XRE-type DNA-binding protein